MSLHRKADLLSDRASTTNSRGSQRLPVDRSARDKFLTYLSDFVQNLGRGNTQHRVYRGHVYVYLDPGYTWNLDVLMLSHTPTRPDPPPRPATEAPQGPPEASNIESGAWPKVDVRCKRLANARCPGYSWVPGTRPRYTRDDPIILLLQVYPGPGIASAATTSQMYSRLLNTGVCEMNADRHPTNV